MKHSSEKDLSVLSSGILGIIAISLLLIPSRLNFLLAGLPYWMAAGLGVFAFIISLATQTLLSLTYSQKRIAIFHGVSITFLFIFSALFFRAGYYVEGIIILVTGIMQLPLTSSLLSFFAQHNSLKITSVTIAFTCGIILAMSSDQYAQLNITPYRISLVIALLATAFLGAITIIFPSLKYNQILFRLQVIPWLAWCFMFLPTLSLVNLIAPGLLITMIIFSGILPWHRLSLPVDDVLGHRVMMIANAMELTLLIFLSSLLFIIDHSIVTVSPWLLTAREAAFLFFMLISIVIYYEVSTILMTINGLIQELTRVEEDEEEPEPDAHVITWNNRLARYIKPFMLTRKGLRIQLTLQADQIKAISTQLTNEKKRNAQLTLLMELSQQLENQLDQPVAAQLAMNTLERALDCSLASLYIYEPDQNHFTLLAAAGAQTNLIPPGFRQSISKGVIGRAVRQRKTQIINDIKEDADYIRFENEPNLSAIVIPLIFNGHAKGTIVINSEKINAFSSIDIGLSEAVATNLTRAWERSGYHERLMNLVQAGSQLSSMVEPESTAKEVSFIAREILQARFTFVYIQLGQERGFIQSASSGNAPHLLESLSKSINTSELIQIALQASQPFRVRDVRKYATTSHLVIDQPGLRSMLTIPIRWHQINIGAIFAFGKKNEVFFTENDESLAKLLSIQTAGAFESTWLQEELRASLRITSLLYRLSNQIIQAENLEDAVSDIAQTIHKLAKSVTTGIVLLTPDGNLITEAQIDSAGIHQGFDHPMELIKNVMAAGQLIQHSHGQSINRTCLPIRTPIQKYGAVWMDAPEEQGNKSAVNPEEFQTLMNQAAIALERSLLLVESRRQAVAIKAAFDKLEATYDQTLAALTSALDARDRETEGHSLRVSILVAKLGEAFEFSHAQLKVLERGSLLHDIGKIGISDTILHKPGPLSEDEWKIMRLHPEIGAKIVEGIPFLEETIPLIRHHQERWNGTGYPEELRGEEIPILARMFAVVDAFDALTSKRPYRQKISIAEAVEYLLEQSGILFDPKVVDVFEKLISENKIDLMPSE